MTDAESGIDFLNRVPFESISIVADPALKAALGSSFTYLTENLAAAEARWAIDNGRSFGSEQLAALADVKPKTVANLVASGQTASDGNGRVPAAEALRYLERRKGFVRSCWQDPVPPRSPASDDEAVPSLGGQVFVPVDGEDYWEALRRLASMARPRWRRPLASGKRGWSLVSAQEGWRRFSPSDLNNMISAVTSAVN